MEDMKLQDERIIGLLRKMPSVRDNRSKQEVYAKVIERMEKKRRTQWLMPLLSTMAAASILFLLAPSVMNQIDLGSESQKKGDRAIETTDSSKKEMTMTKEKNGFTYEKSEQKNYVITRVPEGQTLLTFGVPDKQGNIVVPISMTVDKGSNDKIQALYENAKKLPTDQAGLGEFFLTKFEIKEVDQIDHVNDQKVDMGKYVTITVPEENDLGQGAGMRNVFNESVSETFRLLNYTKVEYYTNSKTESGILFEQMNVPESGQSLIPKKSQGYWLYQLDPSYPVFLVPSQGEYNDFESALIAMRKNIEDKNLKASIPAGTEIAEVVEQKGDPNVIVRFKPGTVLEDTPSTVQMLDAIMMTAGEYAFQTVSFEGIDTPAQIGWVKLNNEKNPVPVAPNPIAIK